MAFIFVYKLSIIKYLINISILKPIIKTLQTVLSKKRIPFFSFFIAFFIEYNLKIILFNLRRYF